MRHTFSLRQVEGFCLACKTRSFSRSAEAMKISQSAFSQLIRELEANLGIRLFDRTTRHVSVTQAGEAMYRKMSGAISAIDEACDEAHAIARIERGHITLGTLSTFASGLVTRALGQMRRGFPAITVTLWEYGNATMASKVAAGAIDLAVCTETPDAAALSFKPLFDDELVVVAPREHRLANAGRISWSDLDGEAIVLAPRTSNIGGLVSAAARNNQVNLNVEYEIATLATSIGMVRNGFGLNFLPHIVVQDLNMDGLALVRVENPPVRRIGIYRKSDRVASASALKFEEFLRAEVIAAQGRMGRWPSPTAVA